MNNARLRVYGFVVALSMLLISCVSIAPQAPDAQQPSASAEESILVFRRPADAVNLDPAIHQDSESQWRIDQIFDTLVRRNSETLEPEPALATSWEVSDDEMVWTFHLRKGVTFHDGAPFTAESVVFNFERGFNPDHPFHQGGEFPQWQQISQGLPGIWEAVTALDEYTVQIELNQPIAAFLTNLTRSPFAIGSPDAIQADVENFFKMPVGTGPFKFAEWVTGDRIILEANEEYWDGQPCLDRLVFQVITDNAAAFLQLKSGAIHGMDNLNPDDIPAAEQDSNLEVLTRPLWYSGYFTINTNQEPFNDVRVRRALVHAINRQAIVDAFYGGMGQVADQPLPPTIFGFNEELELYEYDPEQAMALLAEAGYPDGFETEFWYMPVTRPYMPAPKEFGEAIAADLDKVGIRASLQTKDWAAYVEDWSNNRLPLATVGHWPVMADPDDRWAYIHRYLDVAAGYQNEELTTLITDASATVDQMERESMYHRAAEILHEDVPIVWMAVTGAPVIISTQVENFTVDAVGELFADVCLQ